MEDTLRVACIQMNSGDQLAVNLLRAAGLLQQAAEQGARLALLPENFAFMGGSDAVKRRAAQPEEASEALAFLGEHAAALDMAVIGGSIAFGDAGESRLRNTSVAFSADGKRLASYDKMHLFDVDVQGECYRESDLVRPGDEPVTVRIEGWEIGLSICYDIRFPELYRHYSAAGCEILTIPSAFTVPTGRAHWEALLRGRAIENQCYVLAAAQCGVHPGGRSTWGHSMIVDPWGEVLGELEEGEGVVLAELSHERQQSLRRQFPVLQHRRGVLSA